MTGCAEVGTCEVISELILLWRNQGTVSVPRRQTYPPVNHEVSWCPYTVGVRGNSLYIHVGRVSMSLESHQKLSKQQCMPRVRVTLFTLACQRDSCIWLKRTQDNGRAMPM